MQRLISVSVILLIFCTDLIGQYEIISSQKIGGSNEESVLDIFTNPDGSFLICGRSDSNDSIFEGSYGNSDGYLIFFNAKGEKEWERNYGGSERDQISIINSQSDGGYLLIGSTASNDNDLLGDTITNGNQRWLLSIDEFGNIIRSKKLMIERKGDFPIGVVYKENDDLLISDQYTRMSDTVRVFSLSLYSGSGIEKWSKEIAVPGVTNFGKYQFISDSTILISASKVNENQILNMLLMEVNIVNEELNWIKEYGGNKDDNGSFVIDTDGGYWIVGSTSSFSDNSQIPLNFDFWLMKIDERGERLWQRTYGSNKSEGLYNVWFSSDRILLVGSSFGNDLDVSNNYGFSDIWVLELARDGNVIAEKSFGGSRSDAFFLNASPLCDGKELVLASISTSNDFDVPTGIFDDVFGNGDIWVSKLRRVEEEIMTKDCSNLVYPNPISKGSPIYISSPNIQKDDINNISLYDVAGKLINNSEDEILFNAICEQELLQIQLSNNVQNLVGGVYLLKVQDKSKSCTYKLFFE